jgi:Uma2 family endonuclease
MPVPPTDLPLLPKTGELYEIVNGLRREIEPMGAFAGLIASLLVGRLNAFALERKFGVAVVEVLFRLRNEPKLERRPDVAFVCYDRLPNPVLPPEDPAAWDVVPNLAVEVISPTNTADEVVDKIRDYFGAGVQLVWVLYPRQRLLYAYQSPIQNQVLQEHDSIDGGAVLPGFRLRLGDLLDAVLKPAS